MDDAKLTPEELEEMEKQFWKIVRKYRPDEPVSAQEQ